MADGSKGNVGGASQPPIGNGKGATSSAGSYSGSHDFTRDPKSNAPATGGRDFTKENRTQSEARPEVVPNPQEIPAGGRIPKADPGSVSRSGCFGTSETAAAPRKPFKL